MKNFNFKKFKLLILKMKILKTFKMKILKIC